MRIRISANLSYSRDRDGDPVDAGYDVLREIVQACDDTLTKAGYLPNRLRDDRVLDDTLSVEVS